MNRFLVVVLAATVVGSLAAPGVSAAQTSPALTLSEACTTFDGTRSIGITVTVSGLAPFDAAFGAVGFPDGSAISGGIFAGENGVATITFFRGAGLYTARVDAPFTAFQSLEVDCLPNNKDECKNSGWKTYGVFKNQGDCVSFVATKGKNPPG